MVQYKVIVSEKYQQDLRGILHYLIHDLNNPVAAVDFLDAVENTVRGLSIMPSRFGLVMDEMLKQKGYRKCSIKNYLLLYKVFEQEKTVRIYRLIYGRRSWEQLL